MMEDLSATDLDRIREILVGEQDRELKRRLAALEVRLEVETGTLRQELLELREAVSQRFEELSSIQARLRTEAMSQEELASLLGELAKKLHQSPPESDE